MWYQNIGSALFGFVIMHACDRQTDEQNYDFQDRASIASRGKNVMKSPLSWCRLLVFVLMFVWIMAKIRQFLPCDCM